MFSKNKKLDSRVRFQRSDFRKQLQQARGYKRELKSSPENSWGVFFEKVGLNTWLKKLMAAVFLAALIYLIFIPNFLFIKQIKINGLIPENQQQVPEMVNKYLSTRPWWPQKNLVLLSRAGLSEFLLRNSNIISVTKFKKKFPSSLELEVKSRQEEYVLKNTAGNFIVSNDGKILRVQEIAATSSTSSQLSSLVAVTLKSNETLNIGQNVFNADLLDRLSQFLAAVPPLVKSDFSFYELTDFHTPDLALNTKTGLKILFDLKLSAKDSLDRLGLLLSNVADADLKKLTYIDLRFKDRAYICFKNTACDKPLILTQPTPTATSTPTNF